MTASAGDLLLVDRADGIVTLTLNRPERKNAANADSWNALLQQLRDIARSPEDRVVVITGAGGNFCSGADLIALEEVAGDATPHPLTDMRHINNVAAALHRLPQPTIAKVRGVAVGAGMNLAIGCDLVVASTTARFSEIFSNVGLSIDFGGSWALPRRVGLHLANELCFFADIIDAQRASELGLVNRVVGDDVLDEFVDGWAQRLAAGPPIALAQTKRLLQTAMLHTFEQALDDEATVQALNVGTQDSAEAILAFKDKRAPTFRGK